MWMCYVKEVEIIDLESGVRNLSQKFSNLQFDAEHEAVYGMGRFYSEDDCNELAKKYELGHEVCQKFLKEKICEECFVQELIKVGLREFLHPIKQYLKPNLASILDLHDESNCIDYDSDVEYYLNNSCSK